MSQETEVSVSEHTRYTLINLTGRILTLQLELGYCQQMISFIIKEFNLSSEDINNIVGRVVASDVQPERNGTGS